MAQKNLEIKGKAVKKILIDIGGAISADYGKRFKNYVSLNLHFPLNGIRQNIQLGMLRVDTKRNHLQVIIFKI